MTKWTNSDDEIFESEDAARDRCYELIEEDDIVEVIKDSYIGSYWKLFMDALFAFPSLLLALVFVSLLGSGKYQVIVALGIAFIPSFSRIVRSEYMRNRDRDYVKSARLAGASHLRIMFVHILPNIRRVLLASVMIGFNNAVLAEAGLTYLGIGVKPPDPSLGEMLSSAQTYLFSAPWYALGTGIMMILMILGFSLMAEGLQKA